MTHDRPPDIDLGHDHKLWFSGWHPDRDLNPQYDGVPDDDKAAATIEHKKKPDGSDCQSGITFETDSIRRVRPADALWQVQSWTRTGRSVPATRMSPCRLRASAVRSSSISDPRKAVATALSHAAAVVRPNRVCSAGVTWSGRPRTYASLALRAR